MRIALIGAALCATLVWGCNDKFPGEPGDPTTDNTNWKVAFTEPLQTVPRRDGHKAVVANIDGTNREELADGLIAGQAGKATVAYVKDNAVYVTGRMKNGTWRTSMVFDAVGSDESIAYASVVVSPDGRFITFSTRSQTYGRRTYLTTVYAPANNVGVPLPIMLSHESTPVFSRDGSKLAFYGRPAGQDDLWTDPVKLYVVNTTTRSYVKIADLNLYTLDAGSWLDISPDGSKIAFEEKGAGSDETRWVCVANSDGSGTVRKLAESGCYPIWNADGSKIIYIGGPIKDLDLMIMNADGSGTPQNLTNTPNNLELWPQISPDGKKLMYTSYASDPENDPGLLYTLELANPSSRTLISSDAFKGFWVREGEWAEM